MVILERLQRSIQRLLIVKNVAPTTLNTVKVQVEIKEDDRIELNGKEWTVEEFVTNKNGEKEVVLQDPLLEVKNFTREELEHIVQHSGSFRRTREEYVGVV